MKALAPLAVAERDILALRTARENSARSDDHASASAPRPFSPPGPHRTAPRPQTTSHLPSRLRCRRATSRPTASEI